MSDPDRHLSMPALGSGTTVIDEPAPAAPPEGEAGGPRPGDGRGDETPPFAPRRGPAGDSLLNRVGMRIIRRPYEWVRRPWPDDRVIKVAVTMTALIVTTFIMTQVVHLHVVDSRDRIFDDVTPTGGDMGSHVWAPAFLRDHLLPNWQLSGWSMDWYGGLPVYRFYMVIPALAMVALDTFLPYGVAFKVVAISGLVTLPLSCWAFGRLARFRFPIPELFAFAGITFALNESTTIYGGNVLATMAGEFSFSIAVSLMMLGLGLLARGLDDGKANVLVWAAVVLTLACLSHGIVLIYTAVGALAIVACRCGADLWRLLGSVMSRGDPERRNDRLGYTILATPALVGLAILLWQGLDWPWIIAAAAFAPGFVAVVALCLRVGWSWAANRLFVKRLLYGLAVGWLTLLLAAFWVGPFLSGHDYMTDMKYGFQPSGANESFWKMLFDQTPFLDVVINTLAIAGLVASIARRHVYGIAIGITGLIAVALVYLTRDSLPVIGLLWNPRVLPWVYLMRYLMMMVGAVEVVTLIINFFRNRPARELPGVGTTALAGGAIALTVLLVFGFLYQVLPGGGYVTKGDQAHYAWGPLSAPDPERDGWMRADGWTRFNFQGYEGQRMYPEYHDLVQTMDMIGEDEGCGRALWEIDNRDGVGNGKYGTTMALMLLPYWTDGCIASMEGLFFEASGTTPYHFLTAAAMSRQASNPVRQLRYTNNDASVGIDYVRALGIRYVMVTTHEAVEEADNRPELDKIATSGPWHIYAFEGAAIVEPLDVQPVVVNGRDGDLRECFLEVGTSWFQNQDGWAAMPATGGPEPWQRIDVAIDAEQMIPQGQPTGGCGDPKDSTNQRQVHVVAPVQEIDPVELPDVTVSNVDQQQQSVEFDVSEPGVPVLVRVSYFPNWTASGADGPYRIGPNQMVVIPTDTHVKLSFERSTSDLAFYGLTLLGIALAVFARFRGNWTFPELAPTSAGDAAPPQPPTAAVWLGGTAWQPPPAGLSAPPAPQPQPPPPDPAAIEQPALPPPPEPVTGEQPALPPPPTKPAPDDYRALERSFGPPQDDDDSG